MTDSEMTIRAAQEVLIGNLSLADHLLRDMYWAHRGLYVDLEIAHAEESGTST